MRELYWTKEKCQEVALLCKTKTEFSKFSSVYNSSRNNGWLNEICSHMTIKHKPRNYWTKEKCQEESLKYNIKQDFKLNSVSAHNSSKRNGWLDEFYPKVPKIINNQ